MRSLDEIEAFAAVVEHSSFTRAADELNVGKSAISKQIAKLEDRLGAQLLVRTTRKISTTEVGQAFYERCRGIITELEDAERSVIDLHEEPRGLLRINAPMSFGIMHLGREVADFMSRHQSLSVELDLNDRVVDVIEEGYDLVIRIMRLPDSSLIARKLASFDRVICASPAYWDQHGRPSDPRELADHNCLKYSYLSTRDEWTFDSGNEHLSVRVSGNFTSNNGEALREAAIAGQGVLNTPLFIVSDALRSGQLEGVLPEYSDTGAAIYAIYPHNRHLSTKVRLFVDFLVERFYDNPPWRTNCPA